MANLVTNMAVSKCANAHDAYLECTNYAVTQLNLDNVAMYLDAGKFHLGDIYLGCEDILRETSPVADSLFKLMLRYETLKLYTVEIANRSHRTRGMAWLACQSEPSSGSLCSSIQHCLEARITPRTRYERCQL